MRPELIRGVKVGDTIRLNRRARKWTHGLYFRVSHVSDIYCTCYAEFPGGGWREYIAPWNQVSSIVPLADLQAEVIRRLMAGRA